MLPPYRLLALCARAESHPAFDDELKKRLREFTAWDELPALAESHGTAPLLRYHLRRVEANVPAETARILGGLHLRHRMNNQLHTSVLMEMLEIFDKEGIKPLVLKGLALAYQYYPDPALRPVSDLDLLFRREEVLPALNLLKQAGYQVPTFKKISKSIVITSPPRNGISVSIEVHHDNPRERAPDGSRDDEFIGLDSPPAQVACDGGSFLAPAPRDHLLYLSRHLARHVLETTVEKPLQLKWAADMISVAERHASELDWTDLQKRHPDLLTRLEIFYNLTPLPEALAGIIPVRKISTPAGCNQYPGGWPRYKIREWRRFGLWKFFKQTFSIPSNWWLGLYYGIDERQTFWYGLRYLLQLPNLMFWALIALLGW